MRRKKYLSGLMISAVLASALLWTHFGCAKSSPALGKNEVMEALAAGVINPMYEDLAAKAQELSGASAALCADLSSTSLETARSRWKEAQLALQFAAAAGFGPYVDQGFGVRLDFWPTRPEDIEAAILDNDAFTDEFVQGLGVAVVGMPALEYLLFQNATPDAKHCSYAAAVARDVARTAAALRDSWAPDGGNFTAEFTQAGLGSAAFPTAQDAINALMNRMLAVVEVVKDADLGKPLSKKTGGAVMPELRQSPYAEFSIRDMDANLKGVRALYEGPAPGRGLRDIAALRDAFVADQITAYMEDAEAAVLAIPETFAETLLADPSPVEAAFAKVAFLKSNLSGNLSGLLGVTPLFSGVDAD